MTVEWARVTCFNEADPEDRVAHFSVRVTRQGRANRTDVRRLLGTVWKVPLRYVDAGIRKRNPDIGWPEEVLYQGDPPEVYGKMSAEFISDLRERIIAEHPGKLTPSERVWLNELASRLHRGEATEVELQQRLALLLDLRTRPINLDEW